MDTSKGKKESVETHNFTEFRPSFSLTQQDVKHMNNSSMFGETHDAARPYFQGMNAVELRF